MQVTIEGDELVIREKINKPLKPSATGKSLIVCTSAGNQPTTANIDGKVVTVGFTAYVKIQNR